MSKAYRALVITISPGPLVMPPRWECMNRSRYFGNAVWRAVRNLLGAGTLIFVLNLAAIPGMAAQVFGAALIHSSLA